jgi:hypothetical protein
VPAALYLPTGAGDFQATEHTGGPWDPAFQHGGPPAALLARATEAEPGAWDGTITRLVVDILGPVPVGGVSVASRVRRPGRSVELIEAELSAAGRVVARAQAWRVRTAELDLPEPVAVAAPPPPRPDAGSSRPQGWSGGFLDAMQFRFVRGGWDELGAATVWARLQLPLVDGEPPSGLQRVMVLADCGNGVSNRLPIRDWIFINPDLTVHLSRSPAGEWMCIDAETQLDAAGFGLASSRLYDGSGLVGVGAQSLFVTRREVAPP